MNDKKPCDPVINVKVTVRKTSDGSYEATYDPKIIQVNDSDAILNFKLVNPTPDYVVIKSVSINPEDQDQLSAPSISKNGKQVTLSDVNSSNGTFNLSFKYGNKHERLVMSMATTAALTTVYPEIENNPP
jgi:hypothetical protein